MSYRCSQMFSNNTTNKEKGKILWPNFSGHKIKNKILKITKSPTLY